MKNFTFLIITLLTLVGSSTLHAARTTAIVNVIDTPISMTLDGSTLSEAEIKKAIYTAMVSLSWSAKSMEDNKIEAEITVRNRHYALVEITFSTDSYSIVYKDSAELDYEDGEIHNNYNRWVANLEKRINQQLALTGI